MVATAPSRVVSEADFAQGALHGGGGNAVRFAAGSKATVDAGAIGAFEDFTVSTWVQLDSLAGLQTIFAKGTTPAYALVSNEGALSWFSNGEPGLATDGVVLTAGSPSHVAVTYDREGVEGVLRFYVDGVEVGVDEFSPFGEDSSEEPFALAVVNESLPMAGLLDDVQIYDRALPASDVPCSRTTPRKR